MGNKRLIFAILIVLFLIMGIVAGFLYMQDNSKQATKLQEEMSNVLEKDLLNDTIDMTLKTTGRYKIVEKNVKDYLSNVKTLYTKAQNFCTDSDITKILSADNIAEDDKELTVVSENVSSYKETLEELKTETKDITSQVAIMEKIENVELKQNYIDIYQNIMENEGLQTKLANAQNIIEGELEDATKRVTGLEKVVLFLKNNSKYWEVNDGKLQFTNVNKLSQYYQLLNGDE